MRQKYAEQIQKGFGGDYCKFLQRAAVKNHEWEYGKSGWKR
jgi:hypothetical protein